MLSVRLGIHRYINCREFYKSTVQGWNIMAYSVPGGKKKDSSEPWYTHLHLLSSTSKMCSVVKRTNESKLTFILQQRKMGDTQEWINHSNTHCADSIHPYEQTSVWAMPVKFISRSEFTAYIQGVSSFRQSG